jgi:tetratricopeptide (TPR) repeat protein
MAYYYQREMDSAIVNDAAKLAADVWRIAYDNREVIGVVSGIAGVLGISVPSVRSSIAKIFSRQQVLPPEAPQGEDTGRGSFSPDTNRQFPHNLPARQFFVGRQRERQQLSRLLSEGAPLVLIIGPAGNGKTALLLEELHRILKECERDGTHTSASRSATSGIIFLSAKGISLRFADLYEGFVKVSGEARLRSVPAGKRVEALIDVLRDHRYIIAIDNFETIKDKELSQFAVRTPEPSTTIVTTRFANFHQLYPSITVGVLPKDDGYALIEQQAARIGVSGFDQSQKRHLKELYDSTGGSPLAIKWALGLIRQRGETLGHVVDRLKSAKDDIFREMFDHSWKQLDGTSRSVLRAFLAFGPIVSREVLAAVSAISEDEFNHALGKLIELSLVETNFVEHERNQSLSVHSLTRSFVSSESGPEEVRSCWARALTHYDLLLRELKASQIDDPARDDFQAELDNMYTVLAGVAGDIKGGRHDDDAIVQKVVDVAAELNVHLWSLGLWDRRVEICQLGILAAETIQAWNMAGRFAYYVGIVRIWQQRFDEAEEWESKSRNSFRQSLPGVEAVLADRLGALVKMGRGEFDEAVQALSAVLDKLKAADPDRETVRLFADWICPGSQGWKAGIVSVTQEIGIALNSKKDYVSALTWLRESLALATAIGDGEGAAVSHSHIGHAFFGLGDGASAELHYQNGLTAARQVRRASTTNRCLQGLAKVQFEKGDHARARENAQAAIEGFKRLGMHAEQMDLQSIISSDTQAAAAASR